MGMSQQSARAWSRRLVPVVIALAAVFAVVRSGHNHVLTWIVAVVTLAAIGGYLGLTFWMTVTSLRAETDHLRDRDSE